MQTERSVKVEDQNADSGGRQDLNQKASLLIRLLQKVQNTKQEIQRAKRNTKSRRGRSNYTCMGQVRRDGARALRLLDLASLCLWCWSLLRGLC